MTLRDFKAINKGGYWLKAAEDIPGRAMKGDALYGNCDDMIVADWLYQPLNGVYTIRLQSCE